MTFDAHIDLGFALVATPPSPTTSGLTLTFASGAVLPASAPFNVWVCPAGVVPTPQNSECLRITTFSGLAVSAMLRAQEGTSARTILAGDQVIIGATAKTLTDIESAIIAEAARATAAEAALQPLDSDLTAIAALGTTTFGRSVLTAANAAGLQTLAGLGTAATHAATDFDASGAAAAAQAASQPLDSDLTAIAALTTTAFGRGLLVLANAAALLAAAGAAAATDLATEVTRATTAEGLLAPLASPHLTGTPLVPTASRGTNTTQVASTAYVLAAFLSGTALLKPSGDVTGVTDAAAINASLIANATTILDTGQWYVTSIGMVTNARVFLGSGAATVINTLAGGTAITLTGPGQIRTGNMSFTLASGSLAYQVNGCYDSTFENIWITGSSAAGGVVVNGDLATEQNWVNVVMRGVGGVAFKLVRTTSIYTGSLYLDRVRSVQPPAGATGGIVCTSSAGSPSLNTITLNECVFDNYQGGDAAAFTNVAQVFVTDSWFAVNSSATGKVAARLTGGFQHTWKGNYTYTGVAAGTCVVVTGAASTISIGAGHIFDGNAGATAISASGLSSPSGLRLGSYQLNGVTILTDTPLLAPALAYADGALPPPADELMVPLKAGGECTFSRTLVSQNAIGMTKGQILFGPAQIATVTEAIGHISTITGSTAASGTPTYAGYGVYSVDPATGNLTLVAFSASSANLWDVSFQGINGINIKVAISFTKVAGTMYVVGKLFAGGAGVAPQVGGVTPDSGDAATNLLLPSRGAVSTSTSLTAHPATLAFAAMSGISFQPYDALLP